MSLILWSKKDLFKVMPQYGYTVMTERSDIKDIKENTSSNSAVSILFSFQLLLQFFLLSHSQELFYFGPLN